MSSMQSPEIHIDPAVLRIGVQRLEKLAADLEDVAKNIGALWQDGLLSVVMSLGSTTTQQTLNSLSANFVKQARHFLDQAEALNQLAADIALTDIESAVPYTAAGRAGVAAAAQNPLIGSFGNPLL